MIDDAQLARWRLVNQHLVHPPLPGAQAVQAHLLAVQGEQPVPTSWAVAARSERADPDDLAGLVERGEVLRTHVLRPTWHYVAADDLGWLLDLTAPRVLPTVVNSLRTTHGFDVEALDTAVATVTEVVGERPNLTRRELIEALAERGRPLVGQHLMLCAAVAELRGLVVSGPPAGGEHTYAAFAARVPATRRVGRDLERDAALAELARRYFTGHGPATERDLAYWATLTLADVRRGIAAAGDALATFEHDGRTFHHAAGQEPPRRKGRPGAHLLSLFDEVYRGYQDSRYALDAAGAFGRGRESSTSIALVDGQLVAGVTRSMTASMLRFELRPHRPLTPTEQRDLRRAAVAQAAFLGREVEVVGLG